MSMTVSASGSLASAAAGGPLRRSVVALAGHDRRQLVERPETRWLMPGISATPGGRMWSKGVVDVVSLMLMVTIFRARPMENVGRVSEHRRDGWVTRACGAPRGWVR
jgi:hypothetical protein